MKILLSSIGRRNYLLNYFREALGPGDEVWASDRSPYAAALYGADRSVLLPSVTSGGYVDCLLNLCVNEKIDLVVPLIDPELRVLTAVSREFQAAGVRVLVSPPTSIVTSLDKYLTYQFARQAGLLVPETVLTVEEALKAVAERRMFWPLIVKLRGGSASQGLRRCRNEAELAGAFHDGQTDMIQQYITGEEYGYDLLGDFAGRPLSVYCKKKLSMRSGETDQAVTTSRHDLIEFGRRLAEKLPIHGPADVDAILTPHGLYLLEANLRFGGGYPLSHAAGADFARKVVRLCRGETVEPDLSSCPNGLYMFKQYDIVVRRQEEIDAIPRIGQYDGETD